MVRIILAVIAGFILWSLLWTGSDAVFSRVSPDWYGKHHAELEQAVNAGTAFMSDSLILLIALARSVVFSLVAGYVAALVAGENRRAPLGLGVLLLLFGIFIQSIFWNYAPLWYHLSFLLLLVPVTVLGGRLRKPKLLV